MRARRKRVVLAMLLAVVAAAGWVDAAGAEPSAKAYKLAAEFVKKHCGDDHGRPLYDPDAMPELAAVFQRTIDEKKHDNGRLMVLPKERFAAAAEIATLAEYCRRPGLRAIRFLKAVQGTNTPDLQVEIEGQRPFGVEVTSATGRFPRAWQYRASSLSKIGERAPETKDVIRAIDRKINSGQLAPSPVSPDGGVISLHVAGRKASSWPQIAAAVKDQLGALDAAEHVLALEIRSRGTRLDVRRGADGRFAVVAKPDVSPGYQHALTEMRKAGVPVIDEGGARGTPFGGPGLSPHGGGLARALSRRTGGIDFSSLELRYVADREGRGIRYAFRGRPGATDPRLGLQLAQDASDAFFVWLALPPDKFWVNLNPTEPDRIIDPVFAQSDAGRVLLEADLALKKVVAPLVRPDTPSGSQFWGELEALYGDRPDQACFSVRQWIVPERATVYTTGDELYVLDAPLTVKMESEFIGGFPGGGCPQGNDAFETAKEKIYRRLILPAVVQAVNTAPEFAALRRVYLSRIAAEWFRRRHARDRSAIGRIADSGNIRRWRAVTPWNAIDVFNRYLESVRNGEWTYDRRVRVNGREYILTTVFGGVDFSRTPRAKVTRRDFRKRWPRLASRVKQSLRRPAVDAGRGEVWLGGHTGRPAAASRQRGTAQRAPGGRTGRPVRPRFTG
jgi:hypothetical protein